MEHVASPSATWFAWIASTLAWMMVFAGFITRTPTRQQIAVGCVRHQGVSSIGKGSIFDNPVIVCKDGKVWFAK
jgi:hypothetical protein